MSKLVVDMMGSDLGSTVLAKGVVRFQEEHPDCELVLVGKKEELSTIKGCSLIDAHDVVGMDAGVLEVMRRKDSSMVKALNAVKELKADGVISAGSTGGFLSAATLMLKKIPGVIRPALVTAFPNLGAEGYTTILDVGASNANTPEELAQFALMGSLYASSIYGLQKPRVKLLANGTENGKGSPEGKEAFKLLSTDKRINFCGNIEASQVLFGAADVVVTDGFTGNVLLKGTEGAAKGIGLSLRKVFTRNVFSKMAYLFVRKQFHEFKKALDPKKVGGALLMGVNGVAVKAHGNSNDEAFYHALEVAYRLAKSHVVETLATNFVGTDHAGS